MTDSTPKHGFAFDAETDFPPFKTDSPKRFMQYIAHGEAAEDMPWSQK